MCECKDKKVDASSNGQETRDIIQTLFDTVNVKAAKIHRKNICNGSSTCGCWCERLVKSVGVSQVFCVDIKTNKKVNLHVALESKDFKCPKGLF